MYAKYVISTPIISLDEILDQVGYSVCLHPSLIAYCVVSRDNENGCRIHDEFVQ